MEALEVSQETSEGFSVLQAARDEVSRWSDLCQKFLDWQKREILVASELSENRIEQHRTQLKWLLRFGRAIYLTASDPDYPDKQLNGELNGRLIQLQHSWQIVHEHLPQSEQLLEELFPE